jgi:acyl dehydratase
VRYFEDVEEGQEFELGSRRMEREEMIAFAREYDPQPFHVDEEAATKTPFGGLIASGWQTLAVMARLGVDGMMNQLAGLGSPGVDEVRWLQPVRAGETLGGRGRVMRTRASESDPRRGTVWFEIELVREEDGERVLLVKLPMFIARRPVASPEVTGGNAAP